MIKAGRIPCCSAPRPGDQLTSQISPRLGLGISRIRLAESSLWLGLGDVCLASLLMQRYLRARPQNKIGHLREFQGEILDKHTPHRGSESRRKGPVRVSGGSPDAVAGSYPGA